MDASKAQWRSQVRLQRSLLTPPERHFWDNLLVEAISQWLGVHSFTRIAAYLPMGTEAGGSLFADYLRDFPGRVWIPSCGDNRSLWWGELAEQPYLQEHRFGMLEPVAGLSDSSILGELEAILVPGLGARPSGQRLGQGGGFYDRALAAVQDSSLPRLLVCYPWEVVAWVPVESHDVRMTHLIDSAGTVYSTATS